jgi:excinuclease UvrABC nuclease subunit
MKTKFKQSNISISGEIGIHIPYTKDGFTYSGTKVIELEGSKGKTRSGVYELINKLNGKRYIGQARNLEIRHKRHVNDLICGNHHSRELQCDFNIAHMGRLAKCLSPASKDTFEECFEMRVIIYCRPSELTFWENILISHLQPYYNIHKNKNDS